MGLNNFSSSLYKICLVISKLAYVNLLWILFTILGLGVFGLMPATVGLFAVIRKWVMDDKDISIFKTFWHNYRKEFLKSNLLGLILFLIGLTLYIDYIILPTGGLYTVLRIILVTITILYAITLLYIFPIYVHYEWKIRSYLKNSLLLGIAYPHFTLLMIIGVFALYFICMSFPSVIPFFSLSSLGSMLMWIAFLVLRRVEEIKVEEYEK